MVDNSPVNVVRHPTSWAITSPKIMGPARQHKDGMRSLPRAQAADLMRQVMDGEVSVLESLIYQSNQLPAQVNNAQVAI
jgi:hypothetical protein